MLNWLQAAVASFADFDQVLRSQTRAKTRAEMAHIIMLATATELVGLSMAPPHLTLALLPHFIPMVYQWKREQDISGEIPASC